MRSRLATILILTGLLVAIAVVPASATNNCFRPTDADKNPVLLSQRVAANDESNITNTRGLAVTLAVASPYLHPDATPAPVLFGPFAFPSWVRQGLRIQSNASTYIEYGWEYWWQLDPLPNGEHWQRRGYYINNVNGADNKAHYFGNIGTGPHRFYLINAPTGTHPNKFILQTTNVTTGTVATHAVLDPPYDKGNAFTLVTASDTCNEMRMQTDSSYRYSGTNNQWIRVGTQYYAGWWYGQGGDISNANIHWIVGGWWGNYEEWFTTCYRPCTKT